MAKKTFVPGLGVQAVEDTEALTVTVSALPVVVVKTADYVLQASDNGKIFSNAGAAGAVTLTLPAAVALPANGVPFRIQARVSAAHLFTLQAVGTDVISQGAGVGAAGGKIEIASPGARIEVMNDELGKWAGSPLGPTNWSLS